MKKKSNIPVRDAAEKRNMFLWQVANLMGISYSGFMQKMRTEWTQEEQERVIDLIEQHAQKGGDSQ